jgi:hypothetical protein
MRREVARTQVRLGFHDAPDAQLPALRVQQMHADQPARDAKRALLEEAARGLASAAHRARW